MRRCHWPLWIPPILHKWQKPHEIIRLRKVSILFPVNQVARQRLWRISIIFGSLSKKVGSRFVAITDPSTSMEVLARKRGFRKIFSADPMVGGRYSALTDFGLVPAALLGVDLNRLLDKADWMKRQCGEHIPAARNPGLALGAVLGKSALAGRDKLTILSDAPLSAFAGWIEQIIAESTGKDGKENPARPA